MPTRTVSPGTTTELNQCSFIKDKEVLAQCIERIDDKSHGEDPVETETTTVLNECSFIKDKEAWEVPIGNFVRRILVTAVPLHNQQCLK